MHMDGPNMPQTNPRWRMAVILKHWKNLISQQPIDRFWQKHNISAAERLILTKIGTVMGLDLQTVSAIKISQIPQSKMVTAAILKNEKS